MKVSYALKSLLHPGIHYIGEMASRTVTRLYLDQLTEGQLVWEPIDANFDTIVIGEGDNKKFYDMQSGDRKLYRESLIKMFPEEEEAIDKFLFQLKVKNDELDHN